MINTQYLELGGDGRATLTKTNSLFAFDNINCARTTSFVIPATPANDRAFKFAKDEHNDGDGMRRRYSCQLQDGVVAKDGYLYVDNYDEGNYNAIFVGGDLLGLKKLHEAGTLRELYDGEDYVTYPAPRIYGANELNIPPFAYVDYFRTFGTVKPSYNLVSVVNIALDRLGITADFSDDAKVLRVIPAKTEAKIKREAVTITRELTGETYKLNKLGGLVNTYSYTTDTIGRYMDGGTQVQNIFSPSVPNYFRGAMVSMLSAPYGDIKITFPDDFPTNIFAVGSLDGFSDNADPDTGRKTRVYGQYLGDYAPYLYTGGTPPLLPYSTKGEPLAGRTVSVKQGETFAFFRMSEYSVETFWGTPDTIIRPFVDTNGGDWSLSFEVEQAQDNDAAAYEDIMLADNIANISVVDALKAIAAIEGKALRYENQTVYFDSLDFSSWQPFNIDKYAVKFGNIRRTFSDYAQNNLVRFDSSVNVSVPDVTNYTIKNENLQELNELQVIPFSEGDYWEGTSMYFDNNEENESDKDGIAYTAKYGGSRLGKMGRVHAVYNSGIDALCSVSTSATLTAALSIYQFERITERTIIHFNGVRYVWTEAQWTDGTAVFEISKI